MIALQLVLGFALALVMSLFVTPLVFRIASSYQLFDLPDIMLGSQEATKRRVHTQPIPRLGGIALVFGYFFANMVVFGPGELGGIHLASLMIFCIGLIDDLRPLPAKFRLGLQCMIAAFAVHSGHLSVKALGLGPEFYINLPPTLGFVLAVFIVVGAINAVNMIDGLDGLAGGVVLSGVALLSYIHFIRSMDLYFLLSFSLPMAGAIVGFLRYNTHPASIFMGDGGSNWLGFMSGIMMLIVLGNLGFSETQEFRSFVDFGASVQGPRYVPLVSAVLCLAVPIFDTAAVMLTRLRRGLSPMAPDKSHFHHVLMRIGLSHSQTVTAVYFMTLLTGVLGILPVAFPQYELSWLPYLTAIALILFIPFGVTGSGHLWFKLLEKRHALVGAHLWGQSRMKLRILRKWERFNRSLLYGVLLISPLFAGVAPPEIGYVAGGMALLLVLSLGLSRRTNDFLDSLLLALGALVLLIANNQNSMMVSFQGSIYPIQGIYNGLFILLFISTLAHIGLTTKIRHLVFTPADFLFLTLPLILLLIPQPTRSLYRLDIICLRSLIIFMALKAVIKRQTYVNARLRSVILLSLLYVLLTAVFSMRVVY